jgi:GAF domain-containing protein
VVSSPPSGGHSSWQPDAGLLDAMDIPALVVTSVGAIACSNTRAAAFLGSPPQQLVAADLARAVLPQGERGGMREVLAEVFNGGRWTGDLAVLADGGKRTRVTLSVAPIEHDGDVVAALVIMQESTRGKRAQRLADRLTRLARVTAELLYANDLDAVTKIVVGHMAEAADATVASLSMLVDSDTLALVGIRGGREGVASRWATYPVSAKTPAGDTIRSGEILVLPNRAEIQARYPDLESAAEGERSMVCLPLRIAARTIGVATMSFPGRRSFGSNELEFFGILADTCAQAIDRMRALERATNQTTKLRFLADAGVELSSSLDYQATLRNVAQLAVPRYADWCAISLDHDGVLHTLAVAHVDPAKVALAEEYQRRYPSDPRSNSGSYQVLRTGRSELLPQITDEMLAAAVTDPEQLALLRELNFRSGLLVPLRTKQRVFGVLTLVAGDEGRRFGPDDVAFAEDLAYRAAVAIENSQVHSELREVATRLQQAVVPPPLPRIDGWELASVYKPAGHTDVGGDFYEVISLGAGRLAVFVGDVMGRGVKAATAMAQMRSAVRTLVAVDPAPASVLTHLDLLFDRFDLDQIVTMVYAVADVGTHELTVANAGHPTPVIVHADGTVAEVGHRDGLLFGAGGCTRSAVTVSFQAGDTLLAYTDGLIERRAEDIDVSQGRLLQQSSQLAAGELEPALHRMIDDVRDPTRDDDLAVVAVRAFRPAVS